MPGVPKKDLLVVNSSGGGTEWSERTQNKKIVAHRGAGAPKANDTPLKTYMIQLLRSDP